ncbi:low temperature requirement A [Gloeocapsa sp. PCC 7428]|uniref:low temperature requirement protein A n=1 Tax=Gloeocapsa sp. PCC 7428 TaxID=1173026 RepID=UPI0002A5E1C0|nr:low temperature requirement protein A [Gloeocapsa sp. PCC 7428]AFZ30283.1 low temperature requirement A [Gloeocapsa sp. PCC 7428]
MNRQRITLRLYSAEGDRGERHATWLELFFDLVFVVAIAELAHVLHDELTWAGIGNFAVLFLPVWWLWIDFSYYADQFDVDRGSYRLTMLGVMFGIIVLAITIPEALHGGSAEFATVYAALRLVIIILYIQAWRFVPQSRELTARYTISFSIAFVLWLISIVVPEPMRFVLWGIALFIEISNGPITYATIRSVPAQVSHMDERFGLFVIIVLGEAILAVASGFTEENWQWHTAIAAISGFIAAVSLWWMYFERTDTTVINQALRGGKRALLLSYVYGYSHVLVFAGIVATGVGIQAGLEAAAAKEGLTIEARTVLCGGVALFLLGLSTVQWASPRSLPKQILSIRLLSVLVCAVLIWFGILAPYILIGILAVILVGLASFESLRWSH